MRTAQQTFAISRELRRIGVDEARLGGLAGGVPLTFDDVLAWLRRVPTGIGHDAFLDLSRTNGPRPGDAASGVPEAPPGPSTPDLDEFEAILIELERTWPAALRPAGFGLEFPHGRAAALAALRALPDAAGADAVRRALAAELGR